MSQEIVLDTRIRDWVLLPVFIIMFLVGIIRHYAGTLLTNPPQQSASDIQQIKEGAVLASARALHANGTVLEPKAYTKRYKQLCDNRTGLLHEKVENNQMANMMDPSMMGDMMKKNMTMVLPNIAMMSLMTYFFSGFVICKLPFPLTNRFRGMVQRGVDIDNLDVNYATSLSMYFLILFGLQGFLSLVLGEKSEGDEAIMQQQMKGPANVDMPSMFKGMREELAFANDHYKYALDGVEDEVLRM